MRILKFRNALTHSGNNTHTLEHYKILINEIRLIGLSNFEDNCIAAQHTRYV